MSKCAHEKVNVHNVTICSSCKCAVNVCKEISNVGNITVMPEVELISSLLNKIKQQMKNELSFLFAKFSQDENGNPICFGCSIKSDANPKADSSFCHLTGVRDILMKRVEELKYGN